MRWRWDGCATARKQPAGVFFGTLVKVFAGQRELVGIAKRVRERSFSRWWGCSEQWSVNSGQSVLCWYKLLSSQEDRCNERHCVITEN